jgi:hypothetical protein
VKIEIEIRHHYGAERIYVLSQTLASTIQSLTNARTLSRRHISALMLLGVQFVVMKIDGVQLEKGQEI